MHTCVAEQILFKTNEFILGRHYHTLPLFVVYAWNTGVPNSRECFSSISTLIVPHCHLADFVVAASSVNLLLSHGEAKAEPT